MKVFHTSAGIFRAAPEKGFPLGWLLVAGGTFLAGLAAPFAAEFLRSWKREGVKSAKKTPSDADDKFWRLFGPSFDRVADLLDKGDVEKAREELARIKKEKSDYDRSKK